MYVLFYTNYWLEGLMFIEWTTPPRCARQVISSEFSKNPPLKKVKINDLFPCFFSESVVYLQSNQQLNNPFNSYNNLT